MEANEARVVQDAVSVTFDRDYGVLHVAGCTYETISTYSKWVLEFEGKQYIFTGWNSDRCEAFYKPGLVAKIVGRKSGRKSVVNSNIVLSWASLRGGRKGDL